jgi:threonine dehydrogenase-like Zn-dependent dehydrogenase
VTEDRAEATARSFWLTAPGAGEIRTARLGEDEATVAARFSGVSRGTEALVAAGRVPADQHAPMRCPLQEGRFPFPVKYGYAAVGTVEAGPADLLGRTVFVLHPHQDRFVSPAAMAVPVPDAVPAGRAVLAANMETALTVLWDSGAGAGDRVAVVGAGVVGLLTGYLAARLPGARVTLVDVNPARASLAARLGCAFAAPGAAPRDCDVVVHASASPAGLATAFACAGREARVVEASWHGAGETPVPLGGAFHSRRLALVSSQVGSIPPARAPRWTHRRRLETALGLLADPVLDALISGETAFDALPGAYHGILADPATLCHRIRY